MSLITISSTSSVNITSSSPYWQSIGGSSSSILIGGGLSYQPPKTKYILLSREVEVSGFYDSQTAMIISLINMLGIDYYFELRRQGISLDDEFMPIIEEEIKIRNRENKIKDITDGAA
jgi:hypothetical protein